jgi:sigma-B regulation protein RsbU (phosphoserine phosphatase)
MNPTQTTEPSLTCIVIIDDDFVSAVCLEALLKQEGYKILKAMNGPEGRALVRSQGPDLVLLDVQMPEENGLETCRRLKADPATADVPVIFLTGTEDLSTKLEGFEAGAMDYITKPYQSADGLARIRVHIRARRMARLLAATQLAQLDALARAQVAILAAPEALPLARFARFYQPYHAAGGDFYEVLQAGDQIFDYVVADVSGHNADASLVTSALKVLLHQGRSTLSSPEETLRMINDALGAAFPEHIYLTLAWAHLNRNRKTLTVYMAGHPPVVHLCAATGKARILDAPGDVLGIYGTIELGVVQCQVAAGDRVLLYTDGLIELDFGGGTSRNLGLERLCEASEARFGLPLPAMVQGIVDDLVSRAQPAQDDLLMLGVEV